MTRRTWLFAVLGVLLERPGFAVIVHPSNHFETLSRSKLTLLFFRRVSRWPWGAAVEPVDLVPNEPARVEFIRQVLKTTERDLDQYWIEQTTTRGISRPVQVAGAAEAKSIVATRPGAIAYIPTADLDRTVKVLKVDP